MDFSRYKKLLLSPIITHPNLGGSLNRNCNDSVPDPIFPDLIQKKKWFDYIYENTNKALCGLSFLKIWRC